MPRYEQHETVPLGANYVAVILHVYGGLRPYRYEVGISRKGESTPFHYDRMVESPDGGLIADTHREPQARAA